jgi:hypothetical protein
MSGHLAGAGRTLKPKLGLGLGTKVAKFRKIPRDQLTPEQKIAYSQAIVAAVLRKQRDAILRCPDQIRRERTVEELRALYEAAMRPPP